MNPLLFTAAPDAVEAAAVDLTQRAAAHLRSAQELGSCVPGEQTWSGAARDAFTARFTDKAQRLRGHALACQAGSRSIEVYAQVLRAEQANAKAGVDAYNRAKDAHDKLAEQLRAGEWSVQAIGQVLRSARHCADVAGQAVQRIDAAGGRVEDAANKLHHELTATATSFRSPDRFTQVTNEAGLAASSFVAGAAGAVFSGVKGAVGVVTSREFWAPPPGRPSATSDLLPLLGISSNEEFRKAWAKAWAEIKGTGSEFVDWRHLREGCEHADASEMAGAIGTGTANLLPLAGAAGKASKGLGAGRAAEAEASLGRTGGTAVDVDAVTGTATSGEAGASAADAAAASGAAGDAVATRYTGLLNKIDEQLETASPSVSTTTLHQLRSQAQRLADLEKSGAPQADLDRQVNLVQRTLDRYNALSGGTLKGALPVVQLTEEQVQAVTPLLRSQGLKDNLVNRALANLSQFGRAQVDLLQVDVSSGLANATGYRDVISSLANKDMVHAAAMALDEGRRLMREGNVVAFERKLTGQNGYDVDVLTLAPDGTMASAYQLKGSVLGNFTDNLARATSQISSAPATTRRLGIDLLDASFEQFANDEKAQRSLQRFQSAHPEIQLRLQFNGSGSGSTRYYNGWPQ